jgi:mono/diheme cytochrome c family protein
MLKEVRFMSFKTALFSAAVLSLVWGVAWLNLARADTASGKKEVPARQWTVVRVELPASDQSFPPGNGAEIAASQCQICHSAGMILTQPPLKKDEWRTEIMKMRTSYGAPIPQDQVDDLAEYLEHISGRQ